MGQSERFGQSDENTGTPEVRPLKSGP